MDFIGIVTSTFISVAYRLFSPSYVHIKTQIIFYDEF